ncbi:scavenger receptor class B member 1-like [Euwallacea fornicatus]|uniref:scavenger receptor class B member 1-like n=1 Tax=Euwallacea fornicatus TaxID=995702 RepID=UPI00338FA9DD
MVLKNQMITRPSPSPRKNSKTNSTNINKSADAIFQNLRRLSQTLGLCSWTKSPRASKCKTSLYVTLAILTTLWGIFSLLYTPFQMMMSFRLEMTPGWPQYEWWLSPPEEPLLQVWIFNVTNSERFLKGLDKKLKLQEIGPILYREKVKHLNPQRHPNGTLSFTTNRTASFLPKRNTINLKSKIVVPNLALLLIPAYFHDSSIFLKFAINILLNSYSRKIFLEMSIEDYLWNATDPILVPAEKLAPSLVPTKNVGILNVLYKDFIDPVTVFIGNQHGNSKFFTIDKFHGSEYLPHFSDANCQSKFRNASEGICYPQMITRDTNLSYWRKSVCKQSDIRYVRDAVVHGIKTYRFELVPWTYSRVEWEGNRDCFAGTPRLPNGVIDASPCYWGFPLVISFPHFLHADEGVGSNLEGLSPNPTKHGSYIFVEPMSGLPLEGRARSQMNLHMKTMSGFHPDFQRLENSIIPLAWLEYCQEGVPWYMYWLLYGVTVLVPVLQILLSAFCLTAGGVYLLVLLKRLLLPQRSALKKKEDEALIAAHEVKI